jgi:tetratricopeptide (TPR) repeat protein
VLQYFNRHLEAVERFNRAMQMQPNVVDYHRHRAKSLAALGKVEEALADYSRAVQLKPYDLSTREECERLRDLVAQRAAASAASPE